MPTDPNPQQFRHEDLAAAASNTASLWPFGTEYPSPTPATVAPDAPRKRKKPAAESAPPPANITTPDQVHAIAGLPTENPVVLPWPEVTAETKTKLKYKVGIELTMMPQVITGKGTGTDSRIASSYASILEYILDRDFQGSSKLHYRDPHKDGYAIEVPSKPLDNWGSVKRFYDEYTKRMLEIGLLPHSGVISSGGGHIHMGPLPLATMVNVIRDVQNKPWLMWVFNEPDDATSCGSFTDDLASLDSKMREAARNLNADPTLFADSISDDGASALLFFGNPAHTSTEWLPSSKGRSVRYAGEHGTLELRFFEAPADWEEQEAHLRFAQAYVEYIENTYTDSRVELTVTTAAQLKKMKAKDCEQSFRDLLAVLGLPQAPYERMIKENLHERFRRGKLI